MPWVRKKLHGQSVWAACDPDGKLVAEADQRVPVLYRKGGKVYRAAERNLLPDADTEVISDAAAQPGGAEASSPSPALPPAAGTPQPALPLRSASRAPALPASPAVPLLEPHQSHHGSHHVSHHGHAHLDTAIHVYTDGACTGNPGPMGIGVVILDPSSGQGGEPLRRELTEYLGTGTNNIAELTAILRGLQQLPRGRSVVVYSDSAYSIGLLSQNWKAKANQELVAELRRVVREFQHVRFVKVLGHSGVPENERCDELARQAILRRGSAPSR
ncbi:MAG: ribonuclease H [Polyangia bacterium]